MEMYAQEGEGPVCEIPKLAKRYPKYYGTREIL